MNGPCKNPNCSSCGKPHPHCRCYMMAGGGYVGKDLGAVPDDDHSDLGAVPDDPHAELGAVPDEPGADPSLWEQTKAGASLIGNLQHFIGQEPGFKAGVRGAGQGLLGPVAPYLEHKVGGVPYEEIAQSQKEFPGIYKSTEAATLAASMLLPTGQAGLIGKLGTKAAKIAEFGKVGSAVLKGAVEAASFAGSDEITKALLNAPGSNAENPTSAALLHLGAAALMGGVTGGVFGLTDAVIGKGLEKIQNQKMVEKAQDYLAKLGESKDPFDLKHKASEAIAGPAAWMTAEKTGTGYMGYQAIKKGLKPIIEGIIGKPIDKFNGYVTDAVIHGLLTNQTSGLPNAIHYATQVAKGLQKTTMGLDALFKAGASQIAEPVSEQMREELKRYIDDGQVDKQLQNQMQSDLPQGFAEGGIAAPKVPEVSQKPDHFANIFPEQNILLNSAKARVAAHLNSMRPLPHAARAPFDEDHDSAQKKRDYRDALDLAIRPLKIFDKINKGTLTANDVKSFQKMYPEAYGYLSREITTRITKAQLNKEKPPYHKRQSLSLFLGATLDSSVSPQVIAAAQQTFMQKKAAMPQPQPMKKNKQSLNKTSQAFATDDQARSMRAQSLKQ
jgi:hypothetical protein